MTSPTVVAEVRQFLAKYPPFSQMHGEDVDFAARHLELAYFHHGETIVEPAGGVPDACFIVRQGVVEAVRADGQGEQSVAQLGPGDVFPVGALLAERPTSSVFRAAGDVFCWRLAREDFAELGRRSPVWSDYSKRRLGALLDLSRQSLQASYALRTAQRREMNAALSTVMSGPPVTAHAGESLRTVFERMEAARVGSVLIVPEPGAPAGSPVAGIFTQRDVLSRVVLPERPLDTPIGEVMTSPVVSLGASDTVADAMLLMAQRAIRHVPVIDSGTLAGVVTERDLFVLQRRSLRQIGEAIATAADVQALAVVADDIREWSTSLVAQGVNAAFITRLISRLNDQLTVRLIGLAAASHDVPLERICWLALGSEGREEQTIATDQDNGLILPDDFDVPVERMLAFARQVNEDLDRCGYPLCKGGIMASNPKWCLPLSGWQEQFADWIDHGDPQALLNASIFFDFRALAGDHSLATRLRAFVGGRAQANTRFQKQMCQDALRNSAPVSWTGNVIETLLTTEAVEVDLKLNGTAPFVDAARVLALAGGIALTGTAERLQALAEARRLDRDEVRTWVDAFQFIQSLRLRIQQRGEHRPRDNPNLLDTRELSRLDRRILKEAFRQSRKLQRRLALDYPG